MALALLLVLASFPSARAADRARGEIRLWEQLAGLPSSTAVSADGKFLLVSTADGNVSIFDTDSRFGQNEVLISAPIRDEELQKQRPIAVAPVGDLIALGVPRERNVANSARIYFFTRANNNQIFFTLDGLPSRPLELRFLVDRKNLLLVGLFADKQPPRIWDVTTIRDAAHDPTIVPTPTEIVLPEPVAGFFRECGRSECHSYGVAFPPDPNAEIKLAIASDSGVVFYDQKLDVAVYGYFADNRPDLYRASGLSFSPDGKLLALSRRDLSGQKDYSNDSCAIHLYDVDSIRLTGADRRLTAKPAFVLRPPEHKGDDNCYFSHLVWTSNAIFASGNFVAPPPANRHCRTFRDLAQDYDPFANMLVRWNAAESATPTLHCLGTNTAGDLKPFPQGGVVTVTQDPALVVFDSDGEPSPYRAQPNRLRHFEGPVFDYRDGLRGELSVNDDGSIVYARPLSVPRPYIAFDVAPPPQGRAFVSDESRDGLLGLLKGHRDQAITFRPPPDGPDTCLGASFPPSSYDELSASLRKLLKLRPVEVVRAYKFLEPKNGDAWRIVLGTSHRLLYASCEQHDFWNDRTIANAESPGVPIRNDAYQLAISGDERLAVVAHADGILRWYRMTTGQNVLSAFLHADRRSWVAWTADGYFGRSDTPGGQALGWFQSTPEQNGAWTVGLQPLAKYEENWRKPDKLRETISAAGSDSRVDIALQTPQNGPPPVSLQIENVGKLTAPKIRIRVLAGGSDQPFKSSDVLVGIDGLGVVNLEQVSPREQSGALSISASFNLHPCLQEPGKSLRVWVRYLRSEDHKFVEWNGADSGVKACPQRRVWGLAVGISKYDGTALKYAHQDAERFFDYWTNQNTYEVGRISLLSAPANGPIRKVVREYSNNKAAIRESAVELPDAKSSTLDAFLRSEIMAISKRDTGADLDDIVVVYLAGHGLSVGNRWYFMPSDGDYKNLHDTALNMDQIASIFESYRFSSKIPLLIFIDACRSFSFGDMSYFYPSSSQDFIRILSNFYSNVFLATGNGKPAYELPEKDLIQPADPASCKASADSDKGGGAFTHVLLSTLGERKDIYDQEFLKKLQTICSIQEYMRMSMNRLITFFQ